MLDSSYFILYKTTKIYNAIQLFHLNTGKYFRRVFLFWSIEHFNCKSVVFVLINYGYISTEFKKIAIIYTKIRRTHTL
jgi:hypothetical protein